MVHTRYEGENVADFYYATEEDYQAIKNGEIFKIEGDFDWYYKSVPFENRTRGMVLPEELVCLRKVLVTSKTAKWWRFRMLKQDDKAKIYYGEALKAKIVQEIGLWMRDINPKTKKAFSGRDFKSFINTIPAEIMVDEDFCKNMKTKMKNTLYARVKNSKSIDEIVNLTDLKKFADELIDNAHRVGVEHFAGSVEVAQNYSRLLEEAREKALAEFSKQSKQKEKVDNTEKEFKIGFGKFSEKVIEEFKLAQPHQFRISARVMDGFLMMENWRQKINTDKQAMVVFAINYRLHDKNKVLSFSQNYNFADIANRCDNFGVITGVENLPVSASKLKLILDDKYNYGRQMNGDDFDGQKFINKIMKKCEVESKGFRPACVTENIKGSNGKGNK